MKFINVGKSADKLSRKLMVEAPALHHDLQGLESNLDTQKINHAPCVFHGMLGGISMASLPTLNSPIVER